MMTTQTNHDACTSLGLTNRVVNGEGPSSAQVMFVGEAPGFNEDVQGRPFVGVSGRLLDKLVVHAGLNREDCFITNVVKHRPLNNKTPSKAMVRACLPYLLEEIAAVHPQVIVTLGKTALDALTKGLSLASEHGKARTVVLDSFDVVDEYLSVTIVPWYHPAAVVRNGNLLSIVVADAERFNDEIASVGGGSGQHYTLGDGDWASDVGVVGFDTETTSPTRGSVFQTDEAQMVGYSTSLETGQGTYVPVFNGIDAAILVSPLVEDSSVVKVTHNAKFEFKVLNHLGVQLTNYEDTMLIAYLLGEPHIGLDALARQHLGLVLPSHKDTMQGLPMEQLPPEQIMPMAAAHADATLQLFHKLYPRLVKENLDVLYRDIELPLVPVLASMESAGVRLDTDRANNLLGELESNHHMTARLVTSMLGQKLGFNPNSGEQLGKALKDMGAPIRTYTETKHLPATDEDSLNAMRSWNPDLIDGILWMHQSSKLGSFVKQFIELADEHGYIHTSFNQAGHYEDRSATTKSAPSTGRLSSSGPNLQNIPHHRNAEWGSAIRSCLVPSPGNVLLSADVSQEEPRIIAVIANDQTLLGAFANGQDIYRPATESLYQVTSGRSELDDVQWRQRYEQERFYGKTFFLAWYYGGTESTLADIDSRIRRNDARRGIDRLGDSHPARYIYVETVESDLKRDGFVTSLYGRKRWVPSIYSPDRKQKAEAIRMAANARIQMTAADILKIAMRRVYDGLAQYKSKLILTVHDEVVLDCVPDEVDKMAQLMVQSFEGLLSIELPVEVKVGNNWGSMKAYNWTR